MAAFRKPHVRARARPRARSGERSERPAIAGRSAASAFTALPLIPLSIAALAACTALAPTAAAQEKVTLRVAGAPGDWSEFEHRQRLVVDLPEDVGGPVTTRTRLRLRQEVDSVAADVIGLSSVILELAFEVDPVPDQLPEFDGLQGLAFRHATDRAGRMTWLAVPGTDDDAGSLLREQVQQWLSRLGFPTLPGEPVAVGDEWSESAVVPAAALGLAFEYDLAQDRVTRLADVRTVGRTTRAVLEVSVRWAPRPAAGAGPSALVSLRGTAEHVVRFDVGRGRFLGSTGTSSLEIVLASPGGGQYLSVPATGTHTTSLVDSGDAARRATPR